MSIILYFISVWIAFLCGYLYCGTLGFNRLESDTPEQAGELQGGSLDDSTLPIR